MLVSDMPYSHSKSSSKPCFNSNSYFHNKICHPNHYAKSLEHRLIPREECGIFGVFNAGNNSASFTALGLHALQHRGQEAAGIVAYETTKDDFTTHKAFGKVGEIFAKKDIIESLKGDVAIGHNRYSTSGGKKDAANIQPLFAEVSYGEIAIAHNGNLTNADKLRQELVKRGSIFRTSMDSEVLLHLIATSNKTSVKQAVQEAFSKVEGAFSALVIADGKIFALRDKHGIRPLQLGKLGESYILSSETCGFEIIGAKYLRDLKKGEFLTISYDKPTDKTQAAKNTPNLHNTGNNTDNTDNTEGNTGDSKVWGSKTGDNKAGDNKASDDNNVSGSKVSITSEFPLGELPSKFCIFEYVYFSRPDSFIEGRNVYETRKKMGRQLAKENSIKADLVIPIPDSGVPASLGFSEEAGIKFELGIIRNHYIGRTFIEPTDKIRNLGVKLKHSPNRKLIEGKIIILIDDSIVRGTTSRKIVEMMRNAGAKEIHMKISCPPTTNSCFYGVDTPAKSELLANRMSVEEIRKYIGADSLSYLSLDGMYKAVADESRNKQEPQFCDACFTGQYPVVI